jgi:hypothetical protein
MMLPTREVATQEKPGAVGTGAETYLRPFLPKSANRQRATTRTLQGLDATHSGDLFPVNESRRSWRARALLNSGKPPGVQDGGRNLGSRTLALPESANRQRATMQSPQRLDATHGGELFPVSECVSPLLCWASALTSRGCTAPDRDAANPASRELGKKPGVDGTGVGIWVLPQHAPWNDDFLEEVCLFPAGPHDDQVDALSRNAAVILRAR